MRTIFYVSATCESSYDTLLFRDTHKEALQDLDNIIEEYKSNSDYTIMFGPLQVDESLNDEGIFATLEELAYKR